MDRPYSFSTKYNSKKEKEEPVKIIRGSYRLMKDGVTKGRFQSFYDACQSGLAEYGKEEFLVMKVGP